MEKKATVIEGCFELQPLIISDSRGTFVKPFSAEYFARHGMRVDWLEQYYSISKKGVLRGLHFQLPPHDHAKLVYCTAGEVIDAIVDLRIGSPTYGAHVCILLSAVKGNAVYLDAGLAHGFYTTSEIATIVYSVTSVYAPRHDAGIRWDSAGIEWPSNSPLISARDQGLPRLANFISPFRFLA